MCVCAEAPSSILPDVSLSTVAEHWEGCRGPDLLGEQVQLYYKICFHKLVVSSGGGGVGGDYLHRPPAIPGCSGCDGEMRRDNLLTGLSSAPQL